MFHVDIKIKATLYTFIVVVENAVEISVTVSKKSLNMSKWSDLFVSFPFLKFCAETSEYQCKSA
jgi:hypothetical protein